MAVSATRSDELAILETIYASADDYDFFPFRDKSHDLTYDESVDFFETVIEANSARIAATVHLGEDGSNQERIEAVQSAVLVTEIDPSNSLVILDGDEEKAERFGRAIDGVVSDVPPIATCIQSELYYPTSLLADLFLEHRRTARRGVLRRSDARRGVAGESAVAVTLAAPFLASRAPQLRSRVFA